MAEMLIQISDPHIGSEPAAEGRLAAAVERIRSLPQVPDAVVVTGDLTEHGDPAEYVRVRELLAPLPAPVHVLNGNHDDRAALRAAFALPGDPGDPIAGSVLVGDVEGVRRGRGALRLVLADTTIPGRGEGRLDVPALATLLAQDVQTPTIVALHHPPVLVGVPVMDELGMAAADRIALGDLLRGLPHVRAVIAGHVHRTLLSRVGGCPVVALNSTHLQARLDFAAREFDMVREAPMLAVHVLVDGELVSHLQPI
jgi:3',5'-cyclic AMP phosphodiesterase CpdA